MALRQRRWIARIVLIVLAAGAAAALLYLRDPPWLLHTTSGLREWESTHDGARFRWMGGHASLFVPSTARSVEIPVRTTFGAGDWPITVSISLDDRPVDRVTLSDPAWQRRVIQMPPPGRRRVRRIDIRVDRTRDDNRGAAIGEIRIN